MPPLPGQNRHTNWPAFYEQQATTVTDAALHDFYANGVVPPQTPISNVPLLAVDVETTGLNPKHDEIISIGLVPFSLARIRVAQGMHILVRPRRPLDAKSVVFHHITHSDIALAPDLDQVLDELFSRFAGHVPVVHFRHIEREFFDQAVRVRRGDSFLYPLIDTMEIEARRHRQSLWARLQRLFGRMPASIRLDDSRQRYGLPSYQAHHALIDAIATAELFQAQVAYYFKPETPLSKLWL